MTFAERWRQILAEMTAVLERVDAAQVEQLQEAILAARRVYVTGQGRSGFAGRSLAMRLMHLGLTTHVVGETTMPAIGAGDLLIALSASGANATTVHQARLARQAGAQIAAITAEPSSPLGELAHMVVQLPIGGSGGVTTQQFGGSLFEQTALVLGDALASLLQAHLGLSDAEMSERHSNLE